MARGIALITGASSGIGSELAKLCAAGGFDLILVARNKQALEDQARTLSREHRVTARAVEADLADPDAPRAIFDQVGDRAIDILINNAGFGLRGAFAQTDWSTEACMIQVNVASLAQLTKLFLPGMLQRRSGRILNVASTAGFVPGPFMAVYYASKAFVVSFSHALANETRGSGVTVTALCPGPTNTGFQRAAGIGRSELFKGRVMSAADVAHQGYEAMMEGRPEIIAGAYNRWMIWSTRFAPRTMVANITRRLNSDAPSA